MNRTKIAIYNTIIVIISSIVQMGFMLIRTKLIITSYGNDINGLIQTITQIQTYLLLLESGICSAYLYRMYKPISEGNDLEVSSLFKGFTLSIKKIAKKMMIVAIIVSLMLPIIINNDSIENKKVVFISLFMCSRFIIPYFYSIVPQYMLNLKELKYKTEIILFLRESLTYLFEIILILKGCNILIVLVVGIIVNIIFTFIFRAFMQHIYKESISYNVASNLEPNSMTGDILVHQVSRLVFNSTDNIILSIFTSLNNVGVYSSYNMIVSNVITIMNKIIEGTRSSLSIKISKKDENSFNVFKQILSLSLFFANIICCIFIIMINKFIYLWLGKDFLLNIGCVILFGLIIHQNIILPISNIAKDAKGLFKESKWYTVLQTVLNLIISLLLVEKLGILGVLIGTVIARGIITLPCNYYLVYKKVFEKKIEIRQFVNSIIFIIFSIISSEIITSGFIGRSNYNWGSFVIETCVISLYVIISCFIWMFYTNKEFRVLNTKMKNQICKYIKKLRKQ